MTFCAGQRGFGGHYQDYRQSARVGRQGRLFKFWIDFLIWILSAWRLKDMNTPKKVAKKHKTHTLCPKMLYMAVLVYLEAKMLYMKDIRTLYKCTVARWCTETRTASLSSSRERRRYYYVKVGSGSVFRKRVGSVSPLTSWLMAEI